MTIDAINGQMPLAMGYCCRLSKNHNLLISCCCRNIILKVQFESLLSFCLKICEFNSCCATTICICTLYLVMENEYRCKL